MKRILTAIIAAVTVLAVMAAIAVAHPHEVTTGNGEVVVLANGQNHSGFVEDTDTEEQLTDLCQYVQDTSPVRDIIANPVPVETSLKIQ